jgi:hypothetical protein
MPTGASVVSHATVSDADLIDGEEISSDVWLTCKHVIGFSVCMKLCSTIILQFAATFDSEREQIQI